MYPKVTILYYVFFPFDILKDTLVDDKQVKCDISLN